MTYKSEKFGFKIVDRATFFAGPGIQCFAGAKHVSAEVIAEQHALADKELMERAAEYPGAYVLYDPEDDQDGFMLVGDDPQELDQDAYDFETSMRDLDEAA